MEKRSIVYENILEKIGEGAESEVYVYIDHNGNKVAIKLLKNIIKVIKNGKTTYIELDAETKKNKIEKLKLLDREPCLFDDPKVLDLMYDEHSIFTGYTMEYSNLPNMDKFSRSSKSKKIKLLEALRERVEELNRNGIYIGDFMSPENFLVDKDGSIKLIDLDNYNVHGLDFDLSNPYIDSYDDRNKDIKNVDNYGFNFFTLAFYSRTIMPYILMSLQENGTPHRFRTKENKELINDMLTMKNYEKRYILDSQKKGLF